MQTCLRFSLALTILAALAGCHRDKPAPVDALAIPSSVPELALPTSLATTHSAPALRIYVTQHELFVGAKAVTKLPVDPALGFEASQKRGSRKDMLVVPLRDALGQDKEALLYVDHDTPYQIIAEVLFTLGQAGVSRWYLATSGGSSIAAQEVLAPDPCAMALQLDSLPVRTLADALVDAGSAAPLVASASTAPCPPTDRTKPRLSASVFVVAEGFSIKARGGNITPGCQGVGAGVAVPLANGKYDFGALTACLRHITEVVPNAGSETITIGGSPSTTAQVIIDTMDAVRGGDAGVLFTDVSFGLPR